MKSRARAAPNFALVKYWGKADDEAMMPAVPSLSITLDGPEIEVEVARAEGDRDEVTLDGAPVDERWRERTSRFLDGIRDARGIRGALSICSTGGVPPAAGLASSAAYFASLAMAASHLWGLELDEPSVSDLARRGSVSAARSVTGGYALLDPREARGGGLAARTVFGADHWDLRVLVAVVDAGQKDVKSSEGMRRTRDTSAYYPAWVSTSHDHLREAIEALRRRDVERLGRVAESSCLMMHACAMAASPPILYLRPATLEVMEEVRRMRGAGLGCFFTVDAGPQVKVVCEGKDVARVQEGIETKQSISRMLLHGPGRGARLVGSAP